MHSTLPLFSFFFFNDTATTEIYTLSLHDALPISWTFPGTSPSSTVSRSPSRSASRATHFPSRSEEHTSELQSLTNLVCRLLLEKKKKKQITIRTSYSPGSSSEYASTTPWRDSHTS